MIERCWLGIYHIKSDVWLQLLYWSELLHLIQNLSAITVKCSNSFWTGIITECGFNESWQISWVGFSSMMSQFFRRIKSPQEVQYLWLWFLIFGLPTEYPDRYVRVLSRPMIKERTISVAHYSSKCKKVF